MILPSSMSAVDARLSIERTGFHVVKDAEEDTNDAEGINDAQKFAGKGKRFAQFYNAGYYTRTPQGLDFVYQNTVGDIVRLEAYR